MRARKTNDEDSEKGSSPDSRARVSVYVTQESVDATGKTK